MGIFGEGRWVGWMGEPESCSSGYGSPAGIWMRRRLGDLATWRIEPLHPHIAQEATMRYTDFVLSRSFLKIETLTTQFRVRFFFVRMDL